jgi:ABC-type arginine/histidine transport system permease subunit
MNLQTILLQVITIRNPRQLEQQAYETYLLAVIVAIIFVGISWIVAKLIKWEGGRDPKDAGKRRAAFFIIWFVAIASFFLYNMVVVSEKVAPNLQSRFSMVNYLSTLLLAVVYLIVGFILSKLLKSSKYGTIFPGKK